MEDGVRSRTTAAANAGGTTDRVMNRLRLGVNIDHVATIRNARGGRHPDPVRAAKLAAAAGADGITAHLREDRRHISDEDIERLIREIDLPLNLEMSTTDLKARLPARRTDAELALATSQFSIWLSWVDLERRLQPAYAKLQPKGCVPNSQYATQASACLCQIAA